jgi:hypothetical protein
MISNYDKANIGNILAGEGSWFTANLLRLISKADNSNLELLRKGFPEEVAAIETYRGIDVCQKVGDHTVWAKEVER